MPVTERVLVFPAGMPRALAYLERALTEGRSVVGASSIGHDPARARYPEWLALPYVTAPDFSDALARAVTERRITGIFTPNAVVWDFLHRHLPRICPGVQLVNASPVAAEMAPYRQALALARDSLASPLPLGVTSPQRPRLSEVGVAALFRHAETIPGMCDHDKIRALLEISRSCPVGDVVEIGSWWGKSAYVLCELARQHDLGCVLCVDPWSNPHLVQRDEKGLVDSVSVDAEEALEVFQLNLLPYAHGRLNFMRLPSVEASKVYRSERVVRTSAFGETRYDGRIALLHIDGNHSLESVRADVEAWTDLVLPGGWIVLDDYVWPYGDGPQQVGDAFLRMRGQAVACAFVAGSALFMRLSS